MLSSVLNSPPAIKVNIAIMRAFVKLRHVLSIHKDLAAKLSELERKIEKHDESIEAIFEAIRQLMTPPETDRRKIGFDIKEGHDERILGDSEFVEAVLSRANEKYDRHYELKRRGYDLDRIAKRVAEIYGIKPREIFPKGKQQRKVKARSLFCFWAVSELGMSLRKLARRLEMSPPGVGFSVERGEVIARENGLKLIE